MSPGRGVALALALTLLAFALGGPLAGLAGAPSFAVHGIQVVVLALLAPPLLLLAWPPRFAPAWLRRLAAPPVAGTLFTVHLVLWHLPSVHAAMAAQPALHALALAGFLATGLLAWWCVFATPAAGGVREPAAMLYLFVLGVPLQVLAAILSTADGLRYAGYGAGVRGFGLAEVADRQAGGLILWVPGGLVLWIAISVLWVRWSQRHEGEAGGDAEAPPLTIPKS